MMNNPLILPKSFYLREDVVEIAKDLLGKFLVTNLNGELRKGMIVETEAYSQYDDKACHAYNGKRTKRTETMFLEGGHAYVYLCYGIHHLFNVVTNKADVAEAVLIRAIEPIECCNNNSNGPGKLTKALGINTLHDKSSLIDSSIWIEANEEDKLGDVVASKRIGVDYAGKDANKLWRFYLSESKWVSKK
ncbi:DNA-3-methyladenine glycosylase [Reichenbachiella ulvae]|uniref:Putative 3-methyladenine DNA glycosylase n=1 Tax=Reichenbachiella ulvae TaxID=2980104 RepID=A0ABT3CQ12_9BACT|nr:DNA-3-methyladenine glycosylase [Reichenbachiella ulvae]MCV9385803.1 DNA-3-methyladenine glycosylase [Reichenbachiella ulvae]